MRATRPLVVVLGLPARPLHGLGPGRAMQAGEIGGLGLVDHLHAQAGEQTGQHGPVDALVVPGADQGVCRLLPHRQGQQGLVRALDGGGGAHLHVQAPAHLSQLPVKVMPLPHAQEGHVLLLAGLAQGPVGWLLVLREEAVPDVQGGQEVAGGVLVAGMDPVGLLAFLLRALARVLQGEEGHDHQNGGQGVWGGVLAGLQDHSAQTDVDGDPGQPSSQVGQPDEALPSGDGLQLGQLPQTVADRTGVGRIDEAEVGDVLGRMGHAYREHVQDDRAQGGAQDLRIGELGTGVIVVLGIQTDGDAVGHTSAAACTLIGRGLGDGFDGQALDLGRLGVTADPGQSRVHHIADARHRQGGFGHVGGDDDALMAMVFEDPVLLLGRQAGEEGDDLQGVRTAHVGGPRAEVPSQSGLVLADIAFSGGEDQDVPGAVHVGGVDDQLGAGPGHRLGHVRLLPVRALLLGVEPGDMPHQGRGRSGRLVEGLDRIGAAGDLQHGHLGVQGPGEVVAELDRINGGRGDDQLQIGPFGQQGGQIPQQKVDVQAALVGLVDDDGVVGPQLRIALDLRQEDAVGDHSQTGASAGLVGESHLVADLIAQPGARLRGDALGHGSGGDPSGLGVHNLAAVVAATHFQEDLGDLGGFARAGLA